jgi:predicted O-methyltransferase YrrM
LADYEFTTDWFTPRAPIWRRLLREFTPARIIEIGSWEGRSTCYLIEECANERFVELHCIDTWEGSIEHDPAAMGLVEARFDGNLAKACELAAHPVALIKHKALSYVALAGLIASGRVGDFDLVYVDGSHQASDVLLDAVLGFQLLRVGGVMIFDDYLWSMEQQGFQNFYNMPKPAIDAFVNINQRKLQVLEEPLYQLYIRKLSS